MLYLNNPEKYPKAAAYIAALDAQQAEAYEMLRDEDLTDDQRKAIRRSYEDEVEKFYAVARVLYALGLGGGREPLDPHPEDADEFGEWEPDWGEA